MKACLVCLEETDVIVNIRLRPMPVCDRCCLAITKQTVDSLTMERKRDKESGVEHTEIRSRKDGWG